MEFFLWGFFGGAVPEIYRLWSLREEEWVQPRRYWPPSILMMATGGLFAVAFQAASAPSAIYIGLATPFMISSLYARAARQFAAPPPLPPSADAPTTGGEDGTVMDQRVGPDVPPTFPNRLAIFARALLR